MVTFGSRFGTSWFTGSAVSSDESWDVSINGRGYMVDRRLIYQAGRWRRQSVPLVRQQADTSSRPGESSLNPNGLWRRASESWHHGAGQEWYDRDSGDADPLRFRASKGVDPWTKWQLTLLHDTSNTYTATGQWALAVGGGALYAAGAGGAQRSTDGAAWTAVTGLPATAPGSVCSDGSTIYTSHGTSGVYATTGTAATSFATGTADLVRYANGRLMAFSGGAVYNIVAAGALPVALYTEPTSGWTWTDATEGQACLYACGYAGDASRVYRVGIKADGTGLDVPVVAASLPDGELAYSLTGYLGYVVIGTSKGVRFAVADSSGNLTLGSLIPTASPVLCGEGQDRFVWFGWTNYDSASTGLGRLDLSTFTANLTPAYASDLMAGTTATPKQGAVRSVVTFAGKRVFTVDGYGVFVESASKVASGTLYQGRVTYGLSDTKNVVYADVRTLPLPASSSVSLAVSHDDGTSTTVGTLNIAGQVAPNDVLLVNQSGTFHEPAVTLTGSAAVVRVLLLADPAPTRTDAWQVPLLLAETVTLNGGVQTGFDVAAAMAELLDLRDQRRVITYSEPGGTYRVVIEDTDFTAERVLRDRSGLAGLMVVTLKEL